MNNKSGYISNRTIVVLLSLAILLTISGTAVSIVKVLSLRDSYEIITGAATTTATGQANVTITATTSITNWISAVNFGSGYVNPNCTACVMDSNGQHNQTGACCTGFTNVTNGFVLENTGNLNLSVNYSCSGNCTAAELIGGTNPQFEIRVKSTFTRNASGRANDTSASCMAYNIGTGAAIFNGWNLSTNPEGTYVEIGTLQNATLCGNTTHFPLSPNLGYDAAVVDINVSIPDDAPASGVQSSATFTFNARSSG